MLQCPSCSRHLLQQETHCPFCGAPQRRTTASSGGLTLMLGMALGLAASACNGKEGADSETETASTTMPGTTEATSTTGTGTTVGTASSITDPYTVTVSAYAGPDYSASYTTGQWTTESESDTQETEGTGTDTDTDTDTDTGSGTDSTTSTDTDTGTGSSTTDTN